MLMLAAQAAIAAHALDIEMEQIARRGMFIAPRRRPWMEIAPTAQAGTAQDAADLPQVAGDAPSVVAEPAKSNHLF